MLKRVARDVSNRLRMPIRLLRNRARLGALQRERSLRVHLRALVPAGKGSPPAAPAASMTHGI
jgi:hypothetical protein